MSFVPLMAATSLAAGMRHKYHICKAVEPCMCCASVCWDGGVYLDSSQEGVGQACLIELPEALGLVVDEVSHD